ncbi:MAG: hypothetical protein IT162_19645 [Bryobacterales bacterium]|nr:hypothetical protein [Bryobacterales bacterium]
MNWRELAGLGHEDIWRQFAEQVGGVFTGSGWITLPRVDARWREWTMTLDRYSESQRQYTRFRAPFLETSGFRFRLYREGFFTPVGKKLGVVQDIDVGHERFDFDWVIQSNDEARVRSLLAQKHLRELINGLSFDLDFELKDGNTWLEPVPVDVDVLSLQTSSRLDSLEELRQLYDLFGAVLDWLVSRGLARTANPGVTL